MNPSLLFNLTTDKINKKVEDAVFRVPRHLFIMPNAKIEPVPLGDDTGDDLVELEEDVKKDDFLQLLRAVYPRYGGDRFRH